MSGKMSLMPNISIPRSRFNQTFNHAFDMLHGDVVPVDCFEIVPGDEFSYTLSSLIRMSTPIVPIMGNIKCNIHAFFVPMRLVLDDTEKFYGDPSNHDKISSITPVDFDSVVLPNALDGYDSNATYMRSVSDYLGKPDYDLVHSQFSGPTEEAAYKAKVNVSPLKERCYLQIWNDHFRPSSMIPPVLINKTSNGSNFGTETFTTGSLRTLKYPFACLKGFKQYDYFTASTYQPQFNNDTVKLPLGLTAPVIAGTTIHDMGNSLKLGSGGSSLGNTLLQTNGGVVQGVTGTIGTGAYVSDSNLLADLSLATAASWNDIRYAAQLQKYYERSNYGSRFFEILNAHYGITNPDSRLQRAERLGSHSFYINVSQVVSTADTVNGANGQNLGNTGAVSCTGDKVHLFTKSFSEPGYVMVVMTTKYDREYSSGYLREDLKKNRFEFYSPEFANLGDQGTKEIELHTTESGGYVDGDSIFGYQEHWAEYRYRKNIISGSLRVGSTFDIWTLADSFEGADVSLGYQFLSEDRTALARLLATGLNGPDYIVDTHAEIVATRELPLYSIPGLIDHFGAL